MSSKYLKPVAGRLVPDPERGGELLPQGRTVVLNQYWLRRIDDGDVIEGVAESDTATTTAQKGGK